MALIKRKQLQQFLSYEAPSVVEWGEKWPKNNQFLEKKIDTARVVKYRADMMNTTNQGHIKPKTMPFEFLKSADWIKS